MLFDSRNGRRRAHRRPGAAGAGRPTELVPADRWEFLWITGFPLFEWNTTEKAVVQRAASLHRYREEDV